MDHLRDNGIVHIFFFAIVVLLGVFLYFGGPREPQKNDLSYMQPLGMMPNPGEVMREEGFAVTNLSIERSSKSSTTVDVLVDANVPDSCTKLRVHKTRYVDRSFEIELRREEALYAVCQGGTIQIQTRVPIDMGLLLQGEYRVSVQGIDRTFDVEEVLFATSTIATSSQDFFDAVFTQ
jgi:hypothetical protein